MHTEHISYQVSGSTLESYVAYPANTAKPVPAVMIVHDWSGRTELFCKQAEQWAKRGYLGFAVDMYGKNKFAESLEDKKALLQPLLDARGTTLLQRINAALDTVKQMPAVNPDKIAGVGYCMGGLCVLDLVRNNADIVAAVSVHGVLVPPAYLIKKQTRANVLALHGYDDPMVPPAQVDAFAKEMTELGADWQVHIYGNAQHAFSIPTANDQQIGTVYNEKAAQRSERAIEEFLSDILL